MGVTKKKDGRYACYYLDKMGKKTWEYFGRGSSGKRAAEARNLEIKAYKKRGQCIDSNNNRPAYLQEVAQLYLDRCKSEGVSEKFRKELAQALQNHILPILGIKPVNELNDSDFSKVIDYYEARGSTQTTAMRYIRYLKTILRYGVQRKLITENPLQHWKRPREQSRKHKITPDGVRELLKHASPHLAWAIEIEWHLGARPGPTELTSLRWDQVEWEKKKIWIWGQKSKRWRSVPLSDQFMDRLRDKYGEAQTPYLIEYNGKPIKKFRSSVKTAAKKAGLHEGFCLYELRHLFATTILSKGGDLAAVSQLLGHASTSITTDVYYEYLEGEKERATDLIPDLYENEKEKKQGKILEFK